MHPAHYLLCRFTCIRQDLTPANRPKPSSTHLNKAAAKRPASSLSTPRVGLVQGAEISYNYHGHTSARLDPERLGCWPARRQFRLRPASAFAGGSAAAAAAGDRYWSSRESSSLSPVRAADMSLSPRRDRVTATTSYKGGGGSG